MYPRLLIKPHHGDIIATNIFVYAAIVCDIIIKTERVLNMNCTITVTKEQSWRVTIL